MWAGGWQRELPLFGTQGVPAAGPRQRPTGAEVLSAAVAMAAEGSHATRTDPAHAAPHACARTAHACATAVLRSPATPLSPCALGSCLCPPSPRLPAANRADPGSQHPLSTPQSHHRAVGTSSIRLCPRPQG